MEVEPAVSRSSTSTIRSGDDRQRAAFTGPDGGVPIPYPVAEALVIALAVYGAAGAVFAVPFALRGAGAIDPAAKGGTWGFRVLTLPGVVALWPLMLVKWVRAGAKERS